MKTMTNYLGLFLSAALLITLGACQGIPDVDVDRYQYDDISDDDFDGVINARDKCDFTPVDVAVNNQGCTSWRVTEHIHAVNIPFAFDSFIVAEDSAQELTELAYLMDANPDYRVTIIGDTSPEGADTYNEKLAHNRAQAVVDFLTLYSVSVDKIDVHFFTETLPLVNEFMQERQHRVLALVHSPNYEHDPKWNIFTSEKQIQSRNQEGAE